MKVTAYKTPLVKQGDDLHHLVAASLPAVPERSVVVIASKVFSTSEGRAVPIVTGEREEKYALVRQEADFYTDPHSSKYGLMLTIKRNWMFMFAGIDESNADHQYLLWPADPQAAVNAMWQFLRSHFGVNELGVIMSDSSSLPLNWGVVGHGIAYCGFNPLRSYIGKPDLFGRELKMEQVSVLQNLAAAAVLEMGEGNEQTPVAVVSEIGQIEFMDHAPTAAELAALHIEMVDDAYAPLLQGVSWHRGGSNPE